jgi:hypothetical protein
MDTSFERSRMKGKDEWLTPPEIIRALGEFDLDPCAPVSRVWDTAARHFTIEDNGLAQKWTGRVWCNPPYGNKTELWMKRMAEHNHGTLLVFARTETEYFYRYVWPRASAILFFRGRLKFRNRDGGFAPSCAGAPSCLVTYGAFDEGMLRASGLRGHIVKP